MEREHLDIYWTPERLKDSPITAILHAELYFWAMSSLAHANMILLPSTAVFNSSMGH